MEYQLFRIRLTKIVGKGINWKLEKCQEKQNPPEKTKNNDYQLVPDELYCSGSHMVDVQTHTQT